MEIRKIDEKNIPGYVTDVLDRLEKNGHEAYIVGGCVRDLLLGRVPKDFDVTASATTDEMGKAFEGMKVIPTGVKHGTVTVMSDGNGIEVTTYRTDGEYSDHRHPDGVVYTSDLAEDLSRRDFTINAMAFSPKRGLVDNHGGIDDLKAGLIRCVGDPFKRFEEDALRIMRAIRFSAVYGFEIEERTLEALVAKSPDLKYVSCERIYSELCMFLSVENTDKMKELMLGPAREVIFNVIPELRRASETAQINRFHLFDVYTHSVIALASSPPDTGLRLTMLLHDVAKPQTVTYDKKGFTHFKNHAETGSLMSEEILKRLRAPNATVRRVTRLIKYHEFFKDVSVKEERYQAAAGKILRAVGPELAEDLVYVMRADINGKSNYALTVNLATIDNLQSAIYNYKRSGRPYSLSGLCVSGRDLIRNAGIPSGRELGAVLETILDEIIEGTLENDRKALIARARQIYNSHSKQTVVDGTKLENPKGHPEMNEERVKKQYSVWSSSRYFDAATRKELKSVKDESEIYDRFYKDLEFGTAGLRGVMGAGTNRMNIFVVRRASIGVADWICSRGEEYKKRGVAVSYDTRNNSFVFAKEAAAVFASKGIKTYIFKETAPVPVLSFTVWSQNLAAGVMITASHNPKEYNGYKVYCEGGVQIAPEMADVITAKIESYSDFTKLPVPDYEALKKTRMLSYVSEKVIRAYYDRINALAAYREINEKYADELTTVYSPLHGAGAKYVAKAFKNAGLGKNFYIVKEQEKPDGNFPTVPVPNPENIAAFTLALKLAEEKNADVVIATDPDSDRMGAFVKTKEGGYVNLTGNRIGCLFINYLTELRKSLGLLKDNSFAVSTIVSTDLAGEICKARGIEFKSVLTGFKYIGDLITEENKDSFILGFEESYGFLTEGYARDKDGVAAALVFAEMALYYKHKYGLTLAEVLDGVYKEYGYRHESAFSIDLPGESGREKINKIMRFARENAETFPGGGYTVKSLMDVLKGTETVYRAGSAKTHKIDLPESDVLKYKLSNGWFAIRPSGTEPKIKIYVGIKAKSQAKADADADALKKFLKEKILKIIE
ncbi:MAG: HD domain-containing protein [Clostridia bacterium]|nr:HD domain-containing protein [Clostridia bacterium]